MAATSVASTPGVPSASDLAALSPVVAVALLVTITVSILAIYLGPVVRARFGRPPDPPPTPASVDVSSTGAHALRSPPPPLSPPVEVAADTAQQFINHLLRQLDTASRREDELEHELEMLRQENTRLQTLLWQRGRGMIG